MKSNKYVFWKQWLRAGQYKTEQTIPTENCPVLLENCFNSALPLLVCPQFHKCIIEINSVSKGLKNHVLLLLKRNFPLNTKQ